MGKAKLRYKIPHWQQRLNRHDAAQGLTFTWLLSREAGVASFLLSGCKQAGKSERKSKPKVKECDKNKIKRVRKIECQRFYCLLMDLINPNM